MVSNSTDIIKTNSQLSHQDVPLSTEVENSFQLKAKDRFTLILGYEISLALALSLSLSLSLSRVVHNIEDSTVTAKCRSAIKYKLEVTSNYSHLLNYNLDIKSAKKKKYN
jgi:hypothetical protein